VSPGVWLVLIVIASALLRPSGALFGQGMPQSAKRRVSVADVVRMTRVGEPLYVGYTGVGPKEGFAAFSPDGRRFAFVVTKGNLERNTNDYSLLLFHTADVFQAATPKRLAVFSSASNNQGISNLSWLEDNETILFLGSRGTELTQLYSIRCGSGELRRLTNHKTALKSYATSASGQTIVYAAGAQEREVANPAVARHGLEVTTEELPDLILGKIATLELELFVKRDSELAETHLHTLDPLDSGINDLSLSPDGRYLIVKTDIKELPKRWQQYDDETIQTAFRREVPRGSPSGVLRYELIDTRGNEGVTLLDSPAPFSSSDVLWSPDSQSALLVGVYLPLDVDDPAEYKSRRSIKYVVEVKVPGRSLVEISEGDLKPVRWDPQTSVVQFHVGSSADRGGVGAQDVYYKKVRGEWKQLFNVSGMTLSPLPEIRVDEDLNVPPQIVAVDRSARRRTTILNLNPQFAELQFGWVEALEWPDSSGTIVHGGLYMPPDYIPGHRYPLVIQTHGFDPHGFWLDGPWSTAFAAQPLASRGIVVLQVNDSFGALGDTPGEAERAMSAYESAIEFLDKKGIIDRGHVGITGFSRTCLYVKYTLTHSREHFAAAIASDGFDGGYFEYLAVIPLAESEMESVTGAAPFGAGLAVWLRNSPGFLLDRVRTPIQLQADAPVSLFEQWEWFAGLRRLNKPVDLFYLPGGVHILMKPWERMASEGQSVDWFCFWLKGEEDPNPEKASQYVRWRSWRDAMNRPSP
jgi:dipeptidyl aminopeptidase/acylaminoacyl peptidase